VGDNKATEGGGIGFGECRNEWKDLLLERSQRLFFETLSRSKKEKRY